MFFITLVIIFGLNLLTNAYLLNLIIYYLNRDIYTRLITKSNLKLLRSNFLSKKNIWAQFLSFKKFRN